MHPSTNTMLIIIVTGVALMLLGFGLRDRNIGMGLMGVLLTPPGAWSCAVQALGAASRAARASSVSSWLAKALRSA